jgi:hypothetical protein
MLILKLVLIINLYNHLFLHRATLMSNMQVK